jgi:hypothetical protein
MPDKWPLANGNWSNAANWNGGPKPVAGDDVFADGRTLNVDESFTVATIRNTQRSGGTIGGVFNFNTAGVTATVTDPTQAVYLTGASNSFLISATTGTVTIIASSAIVVSGVGSSFIGFSHTGGCNLIMTAPSFNSLQTTSSSVGVKLISKTSSGTITLNGNLVSGNGQTAGGSNDCLFTTSGNTVVNGNVSGFASGGGSGNNYGVNQSGGTLTINGNIVGGGGIGDFNRGVLFSGTSMIINGSITGGPAGVGIVTTSPSNIITGSVIGGTVQAISISTAVLLSVSGSCIASATSPAIISSNAAATNIFTGPFINTNNTMAVQCVDMVLTADASTYWDFNDIILYSPERLAFYPSVSDIRQGTTYADGAVSGSLAMPPTTAVIAGTPTDNTTGSAVLTPTQLQDAVWGRDLSQMTETGSIGNRLARVSTTGTTGAQIASYLL